MEEKREVSITLSQARKWYDEGGALREVALKAFTEKEIIDFEPISWAECVKNYQKLFGQEEGYYVNDVSNIRMASVGDENYDRNIVPTIELAESVRAFTQLITLHAAWVKDWVPDMKDTEQPKYCIQTFKGELCIECYFTTRRMLVFPTDEKARSFLGRFKELIETAKPLIG